MTPALDPDARALLWRCRRGMKELDVLLARYAADALPQAGAVERRLLARLLERPDPELAGYFLGGQTPAEPELARLVARITNGDARPASHADPADSAALRDPPQV